MALRKMPDRMAPGDGGEKIVSREETPVDVNARSGPRVVFPPLNPNGNPPSVASVSPAGPAASAAAQRHAAEQRAAQDQDPCRQGRRPTTAAFRQRGHTAPAKPAPAARTAAPRPRRPRNPSSRQCQRQRAAVADAAGRRAPIRPRPGWPRPIPSRRAPSAGGGYLVQVSSQKNEADAQASFRTLQGKYPSVLGSRSPLIKRADLGDKGVYYRAMVGPFGSAEEAVAVLRQPENCRRTVRRPKELTAVSLTLGLPRV